jgi:uncharacterized membrane protein
MSRWEPHQTFRHDSRDNERRKRKLVSNLVSLNVWDVSGQKHEHCLRECTLVNSTRKNGPLTKSVEKDCARKPSARDSICYCVLLTYENNDCMAGRDAASFLVDGQADCLSGPGDDHTWRHTHRSVVWVWVSIMAYQHKMWGTVGDDPHGHSTGQQSSQ